MLVVRLCVPVWPVELYVNAVVLVPQVSLDHEVGLPLTLVSAEGLAIKFVPTAWAVATAPKTDITKSNTLHKNALIILFIWLASATPLHSFVNFQNLFLL